MATISRARETAYDRSRGKIRKSRPTTVAKTPYDRPTPPPRPPRSPLLKSPNWITGLVFPATRMIANGAGKLLSVFGSETCSSSSSSSSSSSDSDFGAEDDVDDGNDYVISLDGVDGLNKKSGTSSELIKSFSKEPQLTVGKSETKRVIEQLLMQETFSREECARLIEIINSRVVDCSLTKEVQNGGLSETPNRMVGDDASDLCIEAVMEAKKWLEEKKVGSNLKSDFDYVTCAYDSVVPQHAPEVEVGSPAVIAKSYMQSRPLWASPSIKHVELRTPPPLAVELSKEETPYSVRSNSFSSSKKRDSLATGSWNIQEEIRRVRSRATEDMLRTLPSAKIDLSSFALETKATENSLLTDKLIVGDEIHGSVSSTATKAIDGSVNLLAGVSTFNGNPVLEMTQDGPLNKVLSSNPAILASEQNQSVKGGGATSKSHHCTNELASEQHADPVSSERNTSAAKEVAELRGTQNANGFPSSRSSLSAGYDAEQNPRQSDEENPHPVGSTHDKLTNSIPVEETCELLSEASVEVPVVNETNSIASGSQNSSSMHYDELSHELVQRTSKSSLASNSMLEKQRGKKPSRYSRKGRGRGK